MSSFAQDGSKMATTGGDASVPSAASLIDPPVQRGKIPVIPVDVNVKHEQRPVDFSNDENVKQHVRPWKWLSLNVGAFPLVRFNWVVSLGASFFLWAFVIASLEATETKTVDGEETTTNKAFVEFGRWMTWIAQNFAWLYIGTQVMRECEICIFVWMFQLIDCAVVTCRTCGRSSWCTWAFRASAT